jgi:hypothetical protein
LRNQKVTSESPTKADSFDSLLGANSSAVLDAPITITLFSGISDTGRNETESTLRQLADLAHKPERKTKAELPLLKLASFGDSRGNGAALRNDSNVLTVSGVEGDHDAGTVSVAEAVTRLRAAGLAGLIYTSATHTPEAPRWRVIVPTSGPLPPADRERLCARLNGALGGALAGESFKLSQSYFYGRVRGGTAPEIELVEGRAIDTAPELDASAIGRDGRGKNGEAELLASIARAEQIHDSVLALIGIWRAQKMPANESERQARAAMEAIPDEKRDKRWRERFKDIPRLVADIYKKDPLPDIADMFDEMEESPTASPKPSRLQFLSPSECANSPSRGYVVKGLLAPGDVACIFGAPGAGKSLISPHIGYATAQGRAAFGMRTKAGKVFYVAAEDPHGMRGRISALKLRHGDAESFVLVEGVSNLLVAESPDLAALAAAVKEQQPALIFIDTLAMAFPGLEENSAEDMGRVVAIARRLASHGAAVVLIHHDTKAQSPTPRGHSLLNGALDIGLQLFPKDEQGVVRGKLTKNRNGTCDRDIAFRIAAEEMGHDEDGDPITFALVNELAPGSAPKLEKYSASETAALAVLADLRGIDIRPVHEDEWREACVDGRKVSASEDKESRVKAFRRAYGSLVRRGKIIVQAGVVGTGTPAGETSSNRHSDAFDWEEEV